MAVIPPQGPTAIPGLSQSVTQIVAGAMRLIGAVASGETPTDGEVTDGQSALNQMLDSWNAEKLMVFTIPRLGPFNLTPTKQSYTVGNSPNAGDINIPRPPRIERMGVITNVASAQPLELPLEILTEAEWQAIPVKNVSSSFPTKVWNDLGFPLMTLNVWPIPTAQCQITLYAWSQLTQFTDPQQAFQFPPGYAEAIRFNLAVSIAPEFGREPSAVVVSRAVESKAKIKSFNIQPIYIACPPEIVNPRGAAYNYLTDQPAGRGY